MAKANVTLAFNSNTIKTQLIASGFEEEKVVQFTNYLYKKAMEYDKTEEKYKNEWLHKYKDDKLVQMYKAVAKDGLWIDGKSVSIQQTGVTYDYQAFKNKMYMAYPETKLDCQLVYKADTFSFSKKSGEVFYSHDFGDPFNKKDEDIIGGYCVIKNKRGEFLTILDRKEIEKHRKVSKMGKIWQDWTPQMYRKTVIKDACSLHFRDIYQNVLELDNENFDLDNSLEMPLEYKEEIDNAKDYEERKALYNKYNKAGLLQKHKEILPYIQKKEAEAKNGAN